MKYVPPLLYKGSLGSSSTVNDRRYRPLVIVDDYANNE